MDDESFRQILQFFQLSWAGYRKVRKGVKKRIARHMLSCGCSKVEEYLLLLQRDAEAMRVVQEALLVSISRFFRDGNLWAIMGRSLLPRLLRDSAERGGRPIRVWSAGCSSGEEVYSLRILWEEVGKRGLAMPAVEIWATDANPAVLERARIGIYPRTSLKGVAPAILTDYFIAVPPGYAVAEALKQDIRWVKHSFLSESPPNGPFDLIFLRNSLLTYYQPPIQQRVLFQITKVLRAGGFVVIGDKEDIPFEEAPLQPCSESHCVFARCPDLASLGERLDCFDVARAANSYCL